MHDIVESVASCRLESKGGTEGVVIGVINSAAGFWKCSDVDMDDDIGLVPALRTKPEDFD